MIDRRSSLLLDKSLMVITRIFQPPDCRSVLINAVVAGLIPRQGWLGSLPNHAGGETGAAFGVQLEQCPE